MSTEITHSMVARQLTAMSSESFDIGVLRSGGRMLLREVWTSKRIDAAIKWLRHENARGAQIFVRPHGLHTLSLIDDLNASTIAAMKLAGFRPAVIVETSPANFQVWLNHGRILDRDLSSLAAKELSRRFGGDLSSADWRHFGRLAGFTNQKLNRRLPSGFSPFVKLHECSGRIYTKAEEFLEQVMAEIAAAAANRRARHADRSNIRSDSVRSLADFHRDSRYAGDLHRADMAWALYAASRRRPQEVIQAEILRARDLSKKGRPERQIQYAERTAEKAVAAAHPIRP